MSPGSIPTNATEIFQEGLRLPPLKFRDAGQYNETLVAIIRQNVRIPDAVMGDLNAQVAACNVGARRIAALAAELGENHALAIFDELLDRSEAMTRAALKRIPAGTYRYVDFSDNDGIDLDKRIRIEVAVTVKDGTFHCDFTGSSPQVRGPFNCVPSGTPGGGLLRRARDHRSRPFPPTPAASGRSRSHLPKGSDRQSARAGAGQLAHSHHQAHHRLHPGRARRRCCPSACRPTVPASWWCWPSAAAHADGQAFVTGELIAGGSGAGPRSDGVDVIETDVTNCMNLPVEAIEMDAPIRVHRAGAAPGFRRRRHAARRARHRQGVRDPATARSRSPSRRAALLRAAGRAGRRRRRQGPARHQARRRHEEVIPSKIDDHAERRRPGRHRDGRRRRQRPGGRAQPDGAATSTSPTAR